MTIIDWIKHRFTKSRYVSDDAVDQFTRVAKDQGLSPRVIQIPLSGGDSRDVYWTKIGAA